MKQTKHILATIAMLLCCFTASAEEMLIDGIWYNLVPKAKQAEVTKPSDGTKYSGVITIPVTVSYNDVEYSVTSIGDEAFRGCNSLTSITLPESVTSIGNSAFNWCSSLTSITIPEGVTSIGNMAFSSCHSLTSINIPDNSKLTSIGEHAFSGCSSLTSINIPEGVTLIGNSAFSGCSSLTSITIPENSQLTSIGSYAFCECESLTSITIPESVTKIGSYAFRECESLTSITIPESVTKIGSYAFSYCSSLTAVHISSIEAWCKISFESYDSNPLYYAHNLYLDSKLVTELVIPESVTKIGSYAFRECESLTSITIPESVTSIGSSAFYKCSSLTAIVLPKSVRTIGSSAFANCPELLDVYCYAESVPSASSNAFDGSYPEHATLHVPTSAIESYKGTTPWNSFGAIVSLDATITRITLSETAMTLTEGETASLTITTTPEDADRNLISWSSSNPNVATVDNTGTITAIASGTTTITVTANDGSGVSASCEVTVNELILGTCAIPTIDYAEGKVSLTCDTEGAKVITTVTNGDDQTFDILDFDLIPTYTITAYATKDHYLDSEITTVTLCWIECSENHGDSDGIITIPSRPVLIQTNNGVITLTGLAEGTAVTIYDLGGTQQGTATAANGTTTITTSLTTGSTAIVKIGERSVKVVVK